jgi:PIN domain nuclease of toxin-antitoxin system
VIVLDTHAWLWWVSDPERLSEVVRGLVEERGAGVSSVSCWEVVMLHVRGRITLDRSPRAWIAAALAAEGLSELPLDCEAAVEAAMLDRRGFPGDPADRLIYAAARSAGARLATKDRALRAFDVAGTVW